MAEHELPTIHPVNFFQFQLRVPQLEGEKVPKKKGYQLPLLSSLCGEESFARVSMGWSRMGLAFTFDISKEIERSSYPDVTKGDSVELFIDTRDVKSSGYNTRFCHHFFFLAESIEGRQAGEITRFRTEDAHDLCDPSELFVQVSSKGQKYMMEVFIPKSCMTGYDPDQFKRLGFTYRVNRPRFVPQNFSVANDEYHYEQQPSLWSSIQLV